MIEDLYDYLNEIGDPDESITSILPEEIKTQIQAGRLPVFESASVSGLQPDEQVHYINHMVLYQEETGNCGSFAKINELLFAQQMSATFLFPNWNV